MDHRHKILFAALALISLALLASVGQSSLAVGGIIYVDADASGANNGTSWADAFTTLQPALNAAVSGNQVWVAEGTYKPSVAYGGTGDRYKSFQMKNGVQIFGGFDPSVEDIAWEDRDWENNLTILSGDLGVEGDNSDNSYHVFYHPAEIALDSSAILDGFTISGGNANVAGWPTNHGGGMINARSSPTLINCTFEGNSATYGGGMAILDLSITVLSNCTFLGNSADSGGGMYINYSSPVLDNCIFTGNTAVNAGGGLGNSGSDTELTNCIFSGNSASIGGGMANSNDYALLYPPKLTNCTFSGNSASVEGGGLYNQNSSLMLTNAILWGNTADQISYVDTAPGVTYSDVQGGFEGVGNISSDPLFEDAGTGDFHLTNNSPCIDTGNNGTLLLPRYDFEGDMRVLDGNGDGTVTVDMGVDEAEYEPHNPKVIFVDLSATGAHDGTSWANAYTDLQDALGIAAPGDQIWVAAGTYTPTTDGDRYKSFQMKNGVAIFGGFAGVESSLEERDWISNETVLSGDLNDDDGPDFANYGENSYHVIYNSIPYGLDNSAILDGFTITGGNASPLSWQGFGGGMWNQYASPTLRNCTFIGNKTNYRGGGVYNYDSSPVLINCTFTGNSASYGGGISNDASSTPVLTNCTFTGNIAGDKGGGISNSYYASPVLTNCTFSGNSALNGGGGIFNDNANATVINSILWGDTLPEIYNSSSASVVTYSDVQGGYTGTGNINLNPLFMDALNGDFHLSPGSPALDSGNNAAAFLPLIDFEGDARILDGDRDGTAIVDMGVDEALWYYTILPLVMKAD